MDFSIPPLFGYLLALVHLLGIAAAIQAVCTVPPAQGARAWAIAFLFRP